MASSHGADRISARRDLGDNPRLVLIAPCPPPPGAGKHLQPADWLRDSTMFSVHSKPSGQNQTADSQISTSSGRWSQNTAYVQPNSMPGSLDRLNGIIERAGAKVETFPIVVNGHSWLLQKAQR